MTQTIPTTRLRLGVDLGANRIHAAVFDAGGRLLDSAKRSTKTERGTPAVIERVVRCVHDAVDEADASIEHVEALGVAIPGWVAQDQRRILNAPRLGWTDFDLAQRLEDRLGIPVVVGNDCDLATLAIHSLELRAEPRRLLGIFLGSDIGGGWLVDGRLCGGFAHAAAQLGHLILDPMGAPCRCGNRGCFETLASRTVVLQRIREAMAAGRTSTLARLLETAQRLRSRDLRRAWRDGDALVREVVETAAAWTGLALANLAASLRPDAIALAGDLVEALGNEWLDLVRAAARAQDPPAAFDSIRLVSSSLGKEASLHGAARIALAAATPLDRRGSN